MHFTKSFIAALAVAGTPAVTIPTSQSSDVTSVAEHIRLFIAQVDVQNITAAAEDVVEGIAASIADRKAQIDATAKELQALADSEIANVTATASGSDTHAVEARSVAVSDPNDWRYFHYEGLRKGIDHWWSRAGSKLAAMKAAHELVITPILPKSAPRIPTPLLPTSNPEVLALYSLARAQYHVKEGRSMSEQKILLAQKKSDMAKFSRMNQCVHDKKSCANVQFRDAPASSAYYRKYRKEYAQLLEKLKQEMQIEGLCKLGQRLEAFMEATGLHM